MRPSQSNDPFQCPVCRRQRISPHPPTHFDNAPAPPKSWPAWFSPGSDSYGDYGEDKVSPEAWLREIAQEKSGL
jgi:hypothetical protein